MFLLIATAKFYLKHYFLITTNREIVEISVPVLYLLIYVLQVPLPNKY